MDFNFYLETGNFISGSIVDKQFPPKLLVSKWLKKKKLKIQYQYKKFLHKFKNID